MSNLKHFNGTAPCRYESGTCVYCGERKDGVDNMSNKKTTLTDILIGQEKAYARRGATSKAILHAGNVMLDHIEAEIQNVECDGVDGTTEYLDELVNAYMYLRTVIENATK